MCSFINERYRKFQELAEKYKEPEIPDKEIAVKYGDKEYTVKAGTFKDIAKQIVKNSKTYSAFVTARVGDKLYDMSYVQTEPCEVQFSTFQDEDGKHVYWHSSAHVLGAALENLYSGQLGHGPAIASGFFYDCHIPDGRPVEQKELENITKECEKFIKESMESKNSVFKRLVVTKDEALELFSYSPLKRELISEHVADGDTCTVYGCGTFVDFCRGPHVPDLSFLKCFHTMSVSAAYFKGDSSRESMQRVYGVAFPSAQLLKEHLERLEELKKRDHRVIGVKQDIFLLHKLAPGMPLFLPSGTVVYRRLEAFIRQLMHEHKYVEVMTPNMFNLELWRISGHLDHYQENMFTIEKKKPSDPGFGLKPMNCPGHCLIFKSQHHSKAELPLRMGEFGVCHRDELSGALGGLTRVCKFEQDDAHIFCTVEQIKTEIADILAFLNQAYKPFNLAYSLALSLRPNDRIGSDDLWDKAEGQLREALIEHGLPFKENPGDGAFYGPKIDVHVTDAMDRAHQCGTIQLDFNLPSKERFNLEYADFVNGQQVMQHPVMIHRAILGSVERFMAVILEHTAGKLPFWLNPKQIYVIPARTEQDEYALNVASKLHALGYIATADTTKEKMQKKLVQGFNAGYSFVCVVGQKEQEKNFVTVQGRSIAALDGKTDAEAQKYRKELSLKDFIALLNRINAARENV